MQQKLLIITGPTAVGKSNTAFKFACKHKTDLISCDSAQVYKYMDIGTAKPNQSERKKVYHHLIDYVSPDDKYSAARYKADCDEAIKSLNILKKIPLICGGTGLYLNVVLFDMNLGSSYNCKDYRLELEKLYSAKGADFLYNMLASVDKESAIMLHPNDKIRVMRALEIFKVSGKTKSQLKQDYQNNNRYIFDYIVLNMDREKLYNKINQRVDLMLESGLIDEVNNLLKMGFDRDLTSMQAIGYKEIAMYLKGDVSKEEAIDKLKQNTRNYAKRQLTWFRGVKGAKWLDVDFFKDDKGIIAAIEDIYFNEFLKE